VRARASAREGPRARAVHRERELTHAPEALRASPKRPEAAIRDWLNLALLLASGDEQMRAHGMSQGMHFATHRVMTYARSFFLFASSVLLVGCGSVPPHGTITCGTSCDLATHYCTTWADGLGNRWGVCTAIPDACLTDYTCACIDPGFSTITSSDNYCAEEGGVIAVNRVEG
jgi:hypothetical protein